MHWKKVNYVNKKTSTMLYKVCQLSYCFHLMVFQFWSNQLHCEKSKLCYYCDRDFKRSVSCFVIKTLNVVINLFGLKTYKQDIRFNYFYEKREYKKIKYFLS